MIDEYLKIRLNNINNMLINNEIDYFYTEISDENLTENSDIYNNYIFYMTGFTGDCGKLFYSKNQKILFVDGRFTLQAKNEIKKDILVIEIKNEEEFCENIKKYIKPNKKILLNPKIHSIKNILNLIKIFDDFNIKLIYDINLNNINKKNLDLQLIDNKYLKDDTSKNIQNFKKILSDKYKQSFVYITSDLIEIISFLNIRNMNLKYQFYFESFLIITNNKTILYTDFNFNVKILNYLNKNKIFKKSINDFYFEIKNIILNFYSVNVILDFSKNNYFIYDILNKNKNLNIYDDEINKSVYLIFNQKTDFQIKNIKKANIIDGVFLTKLIYLLKHINFDKYNFTELDIKNFIDSIKRGKNYINTSFDTIVAYKEHSAMCHYTPNEITDKTIKNDSIILIDTGANFLYGTTDVTRVISLYKKNPPADLKKNYTLVLKSLLNMISQVVKSGYDIGQIDIIARQFLYNNYLDYNHSTSHGIGYLSHVHYGSNNYSTRNNLIKIEPNQLQSVEPGIYIENQYGIRLENNTYVYKIKKNRFGEFLGFKNLTLCPFDLDLIDFNILTSYDINLLNNYNFELYKIISKYLKKPIKEWLYNQTKKITI